MIRPYIDTVIAINTASTAQPTGSNNKNSAVINACCATAFAVALILAHKFFIQVFNEKLAILVAIVCFSVEAVSNSLATVWDSVNATSTVLMLSNAVVSPVSIASCSACICLTASSSSLTITLSWVTIFNAVFATASASS